MPENANEEIVKITTDFIRLDQLLKLSGAVQTGGEAKHLVQDGKVRVNGIVEKRRGSRVFDHDLVSLEGGSTIRVVRASVDDFRQGGE